MSVNEKEAKAPKAPVAIPAGHPRAGLPVYKWKLMLVAGALLSGINGYDVSNVANTQVAIYEAFGRIELLPWVSLAYSLVNAACIPLFRQFTHIFELKMLSLVAIVLVMASAVLTGAAPNIEAIIVGRALLGVGGSLSYQVILTYNVIFALPAELGIVQAMVGACFAIGLLTGPLIGGAFTENPHATWRWAFYIVVVMGAVALGINIAAYPRFKIPSPKSTSTHLREIDWLGCVLHMATLVLLGFACIGGGTTWPWGSRSSIAIYVVFGLVLVAYVAQQTFSLGTTPERRILPITALTTKPVVLLVTICSICAAMSYGVTLYYTPLYFAFTRGESPVSAAVRLLPFIGPFIVMIFIAGGLLPRIRYYMVFYVTGSVLLVLGSGLWQLVRPDTSESQVLGFEALIGLGCGLIWSLGMPIASVLLPKSMSFDAAMLYNMSQLGAVGVALAIAGAVYQNVGRQLVGEAFTDHEYLELLTGVNSGLLERASANPALALVVVEAVTAVIVRLFWIVFAAGLLSLACGALMKFEALDFVPRGGETGKPVLDGAAAEAAVAEAGTNGDAAPARKESGYDTADR
ncbi:major facilitator superfamily domain-containing protein [Microdochium trichocladiopsis]|uniref:Major facilitator superfamily domain-containing protein n=1 Tax=Microdochium trichocladiopsis TaxID=1682393 RepID=A0A9P9BIH8_9PEZI|nr:major facilitator superfamily domain-containing protein [Microdochium trichocladiopsis]KAH7014370.1 major facilitator superfamily domain-containing protein [Microdochium trichocladiopsis]